jgi:hypothetical protein
MARNITVTFGDGTTHVYQNAPDDLTPDMVSARAQKDFGKAVTALDGGRAAAPAVAPNLSGIPGPRKSYAVADIPGAAAENFLGSATNFLGGVVDVVAHPVQTLTGIADLAAGGFYKAMPKAVQKAIDAIEVNPEAQKRAIDAATAAGGVYKDRYGNLDSIKRTLAEDPVGAAADLSTLISGGAVATARIAPAASKVLATTANVINPMTPVVGAANVGLRTAGTAAQKVYNALDPKSKAYMAAAEGRAPEIINALANPPQFVPGSMPTAAQDATPAGATQFAALGKQAAEKLPSEYLAREAAQKEAQLNAVRSVGKTPEDIKAAQTARASTTDPLYQIADKTMVPSDATFAALTERPSMDKVLARAKQLAEEKGQNFQIGQNRAPETVPSAILDASGKPMGSTTIPGEVAKYPGTSLHYMKLAFDDLIHDPSTFGIGKNEAGAIAKTRDQFLNWFENKVPEYGQARELYTAGSKPINQMQVGQYLEGKLTPALGEETGKLRAAGFATAVENAPATIKKATTGSPRYDSLTKILSPEQMAVIDGVKSDLSRIAEAEYMGAKGTKASPDLLNTAKGVQIPNLMNRVVAVANEIIRRLKGGVNEKVAIEIATEMLDPKAASTALSKAMERQAKGEKLANPFKNANIKPDIARNLGVVNALSPENQNALAE